MPSFLTTYIQLLTEGLIDDLKKKYVPNKVSESEFNAALDADPTPKKKYLIWLLRNLEHDLVKEEDLYKAEEYIPIVEKLRDKKMLDPEFVNPNEIKKVMKTDPYDGKQKPVKVPKFSFDEFKNYAIRFKEDEDVQLDSKSDIKEKTKVYEAENWEVFIPKTYEQSCILGKGTEWCTATEKTDKYYKQYTKNSNLVIFINKHNPKEKYQYSKEDNSFMNKNDRPVSVIEFFTFQHEELLPLFNKVSKLDLPSKAEFNAVHTAEFGDWKIYYATTEKEFKWLSLGTTWADNFRFTDEGGELGQHIFILENMKNKNKYKYYPGDNILKNSYDDSIDLQDFVVLENKGLIPFFIKYGSLKLKEVIKNFTLSSYLRYNNPDDYYRKLTSGGVKPIVLEIMKNYKSYFKDIGNSEHYTTNFAPNINNRDVVFANFVYDSESLIYFYLRKALVFINGKKHSISQAIKDPIFSKVYSIEVSSLDLDGIENTFILLDNEIKIILIDNFNIITYKRNTYLIEVDQQNPENKNKDTIELLKKHHRLINIIMKYHSDLINDISPLDHEYDENY